MTFGITTHTVSGNLQNPCGSGVILQYQIDDGALTGVPVTNTGDFGFQLNASGGETVKLIATGAGAVETVHEVVLPDCDFD